METHDGFVSVQSQPGKGTTFELYFPGHDDVAPSAETKSAPIPRGHGERILVVDDEAALATLYRAALEKLGYTVEMFSDPRAALERVRAGADRFDLIVTDQTMPGMTGVDLAREIHAHAPKLPVVLTTGYAGAANLQHFLDAGIKDLLSKPPTMESLGVAVHRVLQNAKAR
jgi:CheY-like chemotaxis protein